MDSAIQRTLHDSLFKWLIGAYINEFFELFFPNIKTTNIVDKNKEFLERFEKNKAPVTADFFIGIEAEVEDERSEIVIILELKSQKEDVRQQIGKYFGHAFTLEGKPVWAIVLFTDDFKWKKSFPMRIPTSFCSTKGFSYLNIEVIKLKDYSADDLVKYRTLLAKILALKADDHGTNRARLVREIYLAEADLKEALPDHISLLIERFIETYAKIPPNKVDQIKQEVQMSLSTAATITEFYGLVAKLEADIVNTKKTLAMLERFKAKGILNDEQYEAEATPLLQELERLESEYHP